ncbi:MAG: hypothetical protein JWL83_546 [Actinomycetia bacterium]|nr:hypothetical protein [Actinomycetes bacterium]
MGHRYLRSAAVASIALAPVLAFVMPAAHADTVSPTDTTVATTAAPAVVYDVPTDATIPTDTTVPTTDTTVAPPPTDPTTTTPPVTDPPPTDPPTTTTLPPDTTAPTTPPETTTPTTVPDSVPPVVVPTTGPPTSGGGGTGGSGGPTSSPKKKATPPVRRLIESFPQDLLGTTSSQTSGPIHAVAAAISVPVNVRNGAGAVFSAGETLTAQLSQAFGSGSTDSSWGGLGSAAPRFGPWIVLLAVAWLARTVAASVLADRTAGPRRRRWTLL